MQETTKRSKSNNTEIARRVNIVYSLLLQGHTRKQIVQFCAKPVAEGGFEVADRQADEYMYKAREIMQGNIVEDHEIIRAEILAKYHDLYQKNYKNQDYKEARAVLKDIKEIFGTDAAKKLDLSTNGKEITTGNVLTIQLPDGTKIDDFKA